MTTPTPRPAPAGPTADAPDSPAGSLSPRGIRWLRRRCARRGHVLAFLDDPIADVITGAGPHGVLLRCLRCGAFLDADGLRPTGREGAGHGPGGRRRWAPDLVLGSQDEPIALADVPQVVRGAHGRKLSLLRVLAVERGGRGLLLLVAAAGIARLASSHVAMAEWLGRLATAAEPLGRQIGWDVLRSDLLARAQDLLGHSSSSYLTVAWLLAGYGGLQVVEGIGLWGGWRWAEYLAVVATSAFVPLEVYELVHKVTVLKGVALLVNLIAVAYLVYKGRLFGTRGGHDAYRAEVRDATLLADELRARGRDTALLTSHHLH